MQLLCGKEVVLLFREEGRPRCVELVAAMLDGVETGPRSAPGEGEGVPQPGCETDPILSVLLATTVLSKRQTPACRSSSGHGSRPMEPGARSSD